jgi:hypothetical protein
MTKEQEALILQHFKCPVEGESALEVQLKWKRDLRDSFTFGCDWLMYFSAIWNPISATAVEMLIQELDDRIVEVKQHDN